MNRKFLSLVVLSGMLFSCSNGNSSVQESLTSSSAASSVAESSQEISSIASSLPESTSEEQQAWVDYVNTSTTCRLVQDYKGHDFYTDGIGQVELYTHIDGDTDHFKQVSGNSDVIKSRYFGIDTPESTGAIEPWGKTASNFTKSIIKEASENGTIVVSSPQDDYAAPQPDSTGSRYVSLVWVNLTEKNASYDSLVLLNLWIVQEGYSYVKNVNDLPRMKEDFYAAETQAKNYKLHLFSDEEDPNFNYGDYETVSLLDVKHEIEAHLADTSHKNAYDNVKMRIIGTVSGYSDSILYIQNYYTADQGGNGSGYNPFLNEYGEYAGINIFTGMSVVSSKYTKVGTYIEVCATAVESDVFGFQLSGGSWAPFPEDDDTENARVVIKATDNTDEYALYTFEYDPEDLTGNDALYSPVNLTEPVKVLSGSKSSSDGAITLRIQTLGGTTLPYKVYIPFNYKTADNPNKIYDVDDFVGNYYNLSGVYAYHEYNGSINYQVILRSADDLTPYTTGA